MRFKKITIVLLCLLMAFNLFRIDSYAADAGVVFGSDEYEYPSGEEFPIGVYITGDSMLGRYRIEVGYDAERIEYVSGGTSGEEGKVIIEGTGTSEQASVMLRFRALSGGNTTIKILSVQANEADNGESFNITEMAEAPLVLTGEDLVAAQTQASGEIPAETTSESGTVSETTGTREESTEPSGGEGGRFPVAVAVIIGLAAVLAAIIAALLVRNSRRKKAEKLQRVKNASKVIQNRSNDRTAAPVKKHEEVIAQGAHILPDDEKSLKTLPRVFEKQPVFDLKKFTITPLKKASAIDGKAIGKVSTEPVIQVKNVGMTFKVSGSNVSGLKDYMIQKAKGKIKSKRLDALTDISFTVYKGEVVGIIGTNGSGKSTLLKIVSGALLPTRGEVIADKSKIQLLTLGTGFDGELSARENVYLNGAIIGYSREFIDEHYQEIVEFAELEDFMEEKVKNFSSGMVSRLAFSIATVGTVAEILILDEVLSVGDQFFRKKSMERVKKMIHGGSTVLIVSHSLPTIREHCTKVVWIEKGVLKMVGDPKEVCAAYSKMHETK